MPKKLSEETIEEINKLYKEGLNPKEISNQIGVYYATVYSRTRRIEKLKQNGFKSTTEYREHLAKQKGFESLTEHQEHLAKQKGFESLTEYKEHLAKQNGFESLTEYHEHLAKKRQQNPKNKKLSELMIRRLAELDKTQRELANDLGISYMSVSYYINGKNLPTEHIAKRLFSYLKVPYETLDDLIEDNHK